MTHNFQPEGGLSRGAVHKQRKPYHLPVLEHLGDLRTKTLGTSVMGIKDSAGALYHARTGFQYIPEFPPPPGEKFNDPIVPPLP